MPLQYIRILSGVLAAFGLLTIVFSYAMGNQVPKIAIVALVLAGITALFLYKGWGRVLGAAQVGAQRAGPPARKHWLTLWNKAKNNIAGTLAVISFCFCLLFSGLAIWQESKQWTETAFLMGLLTLGFSITHFCGAKHFADRWKAYWLGLSLYGMFHVGVFEHDLTFFIAFTVSAVFATITLFDLWGGAGKMVWFCIKKLTEGLIWLVRTFVTLSVRAVVWVILEISKPVIALLSGKHGWDSALFGWSMLCFLVGFLFLGIPHLAGTLIDIKGVSMPVAFVTIGAGSILFLASVVMFMVTRLK